MSNGMTIRQATESWVREGMDAIQTEMIEELMLHNEFDWHEVTKPTVGDDVILYTYEEDGEIAGYDEDTGEYKVKLDETEEYVWLKEWEDFYLKDSGLPAWSTMWSFKDSADDYWLEKLDGIRKMSECGFKIFESQKYGYFFGIDAAGFDFYEAFWIPLYKARGLRWHGTEE